MKIRSLVLFCGDILCGQTFSTPEKFLRCCVWWYAVFIQWMVILRHLVTNSNLRCHRMYSVSWDLLQNIIGSVTDNPRITQQHRKFLQQVYTLRAVYPIKVKYGSHFTMFFTFLDAFEILNERKDACIYCKYHRRSRTLLQGLLTPVYFQIPSLFDFVLRCFR